ncbi:SDR family oxidoreductase [Mycolicibacterium sp. 624]|uniref:SDR family NAD(P)-dependent oxidoreductase n=1 Tax=Mycolicibacterium sp. 624 TaxID=3156314 RepID=UPI00339AB5D8
MTIVDKFRLDGRVAIITGASSSLGAAFAKGLAEAGADLVLAARRVDELERIAETVRGIGRRALVVETDVTDSRECTALVDAAMEEFGRVDILVNNAGVGSVGPATRQGPQEFRSVLDVNLYGTYWAAQACGLVMQPGSSIVNVSSILGITTTGLPQAAYSASKAAVIGLTRDLAQQWGTRKGIRVNAIAPGFFASETSSENYDDDLVGLSDRMILGRTGDPDELAATVVWLASDAGGYVTGQTVSVDGGVSIT